MKKIVFLKGRLHFKGGLEKQTLALANQFVKTQCNVTVLTTSPSPLEKSVLTSVKSISTSSKLSFLSLLKFDLACKKWIKHHHYDVIFGLERTTYQTHYRAGSGVHAVYLKQRKWIESPLKIFSFYLNPLHLLLLYFEKKAFESPYLQRIFTNSQMVKEEILRTYRVLPEKIEVIHNGVEWKAFEPFFLSSFSKPREKEAFVFLFVGNGYKRKGLDFLLQGLSLIKDQNFELTVVGKEKNQKRYEKLVQTLNLKGKVHFLGPQNDLTLFYQKSDAIVIPSLYDPFANVTLEALAMGLFAVTSAFNGAKEVLQPFSGTVIKDLFSPQSVAQALRLAMKNFKTFNSAKKIRDSVVYLEFSNQLDKIVDQTLSLS